MSCTRENPGPTAPEQGLIMAIRISSWYLTAERVPLAHTGVDGGPSYDTPVHRVTAKLFMLDAAAGRITFLILLGYEHRSH